jgi:hypothetical protein
MAAALRFAMQFFQQVLKAVPFHKAICAAGFQQAP